MWKETEEINKNDKRKKLNTNTALFKLTDKKGKERKSEYDEIYRENNKERKKENDRNWRNNNLEYKHAKIENMLKNIEKKKLKIVRSGVTKIKTI